MERCLSSLRQSTQPTDVMVLDNGSADGTVERLRSHYPEVMIVENGQNLGFGRANNIGMKYALEHGYDAVLLLNQDAWVGSGALQRLADVSSRHPQYAILSPIHLTGSSTPEPSQAEAGRVEHGFAIYSGVSDLHQQPDAEVVSVPFIDAAIWFMPCQALRRVGLFAPLFYHYGEDKDLCNRMAWHGLKVGFVPHCYGCHDREKRQLTRDSFFRAERTYHLSQYANINLSFGRAFALGVLAQLKKSAQSLLHGHAHNAATYLWQALCLTARTGEVAATRREAKLLNS